MAKVFGSDAIAAQLRALDLAFVCINPGASFRGLHDSIVNFLGNTDPRIVLCLHEEHAVAIAHGYAKVTGRPIGVILHSNVGLMHASMAIFNAWCDRVPVILLGATGPVDAAKRRPWIDWIHTSRDQASLIRPFIKWDDQPTSVSSAQEALLRAKQIALTAPHGPVFVTLDAELQESPLLELPAMPDANRYLPAPPSHPAPDAVAMAATWLSSARNPVMLIGRVDRSQSGWDSRVSLAEKLGASVLTDLKQGAAFPTDHSLHAAAPGFFLSPEAAETLRDADVVLSLEWVDLGGTLAQAWGRDPVTARVIRVSVDQYSHTGWGMEHHALPPSDLYLMCEPQAMVDALSSAIEGHRAGRRSGRAAIAAPTAIAAPAAVESGVVDLRVVAQTLRQCVGDEPISLLRLPLGWSGDLWHFHHPLDYLGYDGGGGIGSGPGMAVGGALGLRGSGRLPVAILGDGDFMMGVTAVWTAASLKLPLLIIVANNRSFFNDEIHQEKVARDRGRPVENRWIGQRISDPDIDIARIASAQGAHGIGPIATVEALQPALEEALMRVRSGDTVVVDARVIPGYTPAMASGMSRSASR